MQIEEEPFMVAGQKTLPHRAIELAGGINVASSYTFYPKLQREMALKLNPDIIIIPVTRGQEKKFKRMERSWKKTGKKVYLIDGDLISRATPRFLEGVETLSKLITHDNAY